MRQWLAWILALSCMQILAGCSSPAPEKNGGFIRKTYTGVVGEIPEENCLRVDVGDDEVLDFGLDDTSEIEGDATVAVGDTVEIDCVLWYETGTYSVLHLTVVDGPSQP